MKDYTGKFFTPHASDEVNPQQMPPVSAAIPVAGSAHISGLKLDINYSAATIWPSLPSQAALNAASSPCA